MDYSKGGSPIKVAMAGLILVILFVSAIAGINLMSTSVSEEVDNNTNYFEENNSQTENSEMKNKDLNREKSLLEAHYRSSNIAFTL